jgi:hypothetical protein
MLAGAYPFAEASREDWRAAVLAGNAVPLGRHWPEAPAALVRLFTRTFSPNVQERPRSARRLLEEVQRAIG